MGKMLRIFTIFALLCALVSSINAADFSAFDKDFTKASKEIKIKIYNDLKGLYIKAVMNGKNADKIAALTRLIKASKALGLEYAIYEKELNKLSKNTTNNSGPKQNDIKQEKEQKVLAPSAKKQAAPKAIISSLKSSDDELRLKLNSKIEQNNIKSFILKDANSYRKVYDINAILAMKTPKLKDSIAPTIRIAQKDENTVRIVFEAKKELSINLNIDQNELVFSPAVKSKQEANGASKVASTSTKATSANKDDNDEIKEESPKIASAQTSALLSKKQRASKTIVIDPGHGGDDSGAVSYDKKLKEKIIVLNISKKAAKILKDRGYKVYYTRSSDRFVKLRARTSFANDKNANLFISIHANAAPNKQKGQTMNGIETFFLSPTRSERSMNAANLENKADTDEMNYFTKISFLNFLNREKIIASNKLAIDLQSALLKNVKTSYKVSDGGIREAPFWVLVGALMPAVLIEVGYISHPTESKLIANDKYQNALAHGIADGIDAYFAKNP